MSESLTQNPTSALVRNDSDAAVNEQSEIANHFRGFKSNVFAFAFLLAINFVCSGDSLKMFFFAEDTEHVAHAWRAFNGMQHCFWTNFYGAWMNDPSMFVFYRPLPELTFGLDYWLYGTNPVGYHITNFIWHQLATFTLFLFLSRLLSGFGGIESRLVALIASVLFASSPLNPEAINWLVNRTDLICMVFMMLSLWSFVGALTAQKSSRMSAFSVVFMLLALICKESAITIPALAFAIFVFLKGGAFNWNTVKAAARSTLSLWLLLAAYLIFRFVVLGGPGGYSGSIATMYADNLITRITSGSNWILCFYPINIHVQSHLIEGLATLLSLLYITVGWVMLIRLLSRTWTNKSVAIVLFALAAFLITLTPTLQCWCITSTLLSGRFMYIPSAFLGLALACVVLPIGASTIKRSPIWIAGISVSILFALVSCTLHILNNQPWLTASDNSRQFFSSLPAMMKMMPPKDKVTVLNFPLDERNALTPFKREQLRMPLSPPFNRTNEDLSSNLVATQSYWFGPEIKNTSRIEEFIEIPGNHGLLWDSSKMTLVRCAQGEFPTLGASLDEARCAEIRNPQPGQEPIMIYNLESSGIDVRLAHLVAVTVAPRNRLVTQSSQGRLPGCTINWTSSDCPLVLPSSTMFNFANSTNSETIFFPVAERVRWRLAAQRLNQLMVTPSSGYVVTSVQLLNDACVVPKLSVVGGRQTTPDGSYPLSNKLETQFDCSQIDGATSTIIEISEPNVHFHHLTGTYRDKERSKHAAKRLVVPTTKGTFTLERKLLASGSAHYDVRVLAVDSSDKILGFASDPLEIEVK